MEPEHVIVGPDFITTHQVFKVVNKIVHFEKSTKIVRNTGPTLERALIFGFSTFRVRYNLQMVKKWRFL